MNNYTVSINGKQQAFEWGNIKDDSGLVLIYVGRDARDGRS
jgi:hypothetical protein